ncbi:DENN (AEX-3) domain-containing protein [Trifolium repens]|nr:DENN (AEX-3) domain-containing protein [Trifolium repens]
MTGMAKEEDVLRADVKSTLSSKDDNSGSSQLLRLQYQVTKLFKGFSSSPDLENQNTNYNPEILTTLKRQWAANFHLKYMGQKSWKEPSRLFESMVVVGLHPNCDVQALHRQFVDRKLEGSDKLRSDLGCQNQSRAESNIEPQVLFVYPPEKRLPLKRKDLLSFCFPGGLEVQAVERTPSMSALNEIFFGQEHLKQMDLSFVFRLQGSDNSTLYGCCVLVEELVQKPSGLLSLISDKQPSYSSLRRYILTTQRCYCILSRLPFFELHFGVLNSIFTQERLEKLTKSVGDSNLEFVEGSYDEENSEGNSECVLVSDDIIEHGFHENSISSQSRAIRSTSENIVGDDHPENLKVNGELQSYKERIDYDSDVPTEHETDRTATKEESGPTISEDSDGQPENHMVDGELQSNKKRIDYDSVLPNEHETERTAVKEEPGTTISEDSDGQPENLMVDGDLHSYKERIDYDSVVLTENGTDRTAAKEETGAAISEDSDGHPESLVDGELQSYKKRIDYDSVVPTEHETDRTTAKEESDPIISEDSDGQPEILAVDGELHSYEERINYDSVVSTKHETDRTTATEESVPIISEDNQNGDAFTTNKELEDRNLPNAILPLVHYCQYESSESSCSFQGSPCEDRNFRSDNDDNEAEDASFSGQEKLDDLNDILDWAVENDHGPLQIICKYYQLSCLARGSALTFHPLEHLHPLEYHRPAATVLCRTGSTIDLENFSTGLDLADAQNTLVVEEATSLSVWTIACLCGTLRLENVLTFLAGVLLEKQILVACSNLGILSAAVLSVIPLIQPYRWQSLLMTVLPNDMLEFLDAPVPFIVGIKNKNKTSEAQSKFTNVIVVDANRNQVTSPTMPQLPRQKELISSLRPYHATLVGESYLGRRRPVYDCTEMQIGAAKGFLSVLRSYLDSLCYNIRSHTITNVQSNDDKVSLLLKESFIDSFPYRDRPFMKVYFLSSLYALC